MRKNSVIIGLLYFCVSAIYAQKLPSQVGYVDNGRCSYFINDRGGAYTRSGEVYDMKAMEGAHPLIPFGSLVRVTNLDNGKIAILRINDRPLSHKRILDVTHKAADKLGILADSAWAANVQVVVLKLNVKRNANRNYDNLVKNQPITVTNIAPASSSSASSTTLSPLAQKFKKVNLYSASGQVVSLRGYAIQVSGFGQVEKAVQVAKEMTAKYNRQFYIQSGWSQGARYYRVVTGEYASKELAKKSLALLKDKGITGFVRPHFKK